MVILPEHLIAYIFTYVSSPTAQPIKELTEDYSVFLLIIKQCLENTPERIKNHLEKCDVSFYKFACRFHNKKYIDFCLGGNEEDVEKEHVLHFFYDFKLGNTESREKMTVVDY